MSGDELSSEIRPNWGELSWANILLGQVVLGQVVIRQSCPEPTYSTEVCLKIRHLCVLAVKMAAISWEATLS